jgi:hypothetical protein
VKGENIKKGNKKPLPWIGSGFIEILFSPNSINTDSVPGIKN